MFEDMEDLANGGTLFLDEVGNIGQPVQAKRLRMLEEREFYRVGGGKLIKVDVRVLVATNRLAHYNKTLSKRVQGFTKEVVERFLAYGWPGNVRELRNVVERAVLLTTGDMIVEVDLPGSASGGAQVPSGVGSIDDSLPLLQIIEQIQERVEREYLDGLLKRYFGGIERTAKHAGITSRALYNKMKRYGLRKEDYR